VAAPAREAVALPGLSGIDSVLGLRHVAGNTALYLQLLDRFRSSQRNALREIREDVEVGLRLDAGARAHALRGVAGNIGAREVQTCAQVVEDLLRGPEPASDVVLEKVNALDSALMQVLDGLDRYFEGLAAPLPAPRSNGESGQQALAQLERLLDEFSGDTTDYFEHARAALADVLAPQVLERLAGHLARYEFDEARRLLAADATPTP
jgi:HPt (histidine-containing phosphotransfer) domain-containing protein